MVCLLTYNLSLVHSLYNLNMSSDYHDELVSVIRGVHDKLRKAYSDSTGDYNKVWKEHLSEDALRQKYACAMFKLATEVWSKNDSRINWCYKICMDYFHLGGLQRILNREKKLALLTGDNPEIENCLLEFKGKIQLLDVGSCYNPFSRFEEFNCIAVDLTPATTDVYQCDFLQLNITSSASASTGTDLSSPLTSLAENFFHVIVFSLVLEYLPAAELRWLFCVKAYKLLKQNGLLIIITPDSKSQHRNAPMIKSWKTALSNLGFKRVYYEKQQHIHCMAFCKLLKQNVDDIVENHKGLAKLMYLPQDFKIYCEAEATESIERNEAGDEDVRRSFQELPIEVGLF